MEEAQKQVNKLSGLSHRSFNLKEDALKAFDSYIDKQVAASCSTLSVEEMSYATSNANGSASASASASTNPLKLKRKLNWKMHRHI